MKRLEKAHVNDRADRSTKLSWKRCARRNALARCRAVSRAALAPAATTEVGVSYCALWRLGMEYVLFVGSRRPLGSCCTTRCVRGLNREQRANLCTNLSAGEGSWGDIELSWDTGKNCADSVNGGPDPGLEAARK